MTSNKNQADETIPTIHSCISLVRQTQLNGDTAPWQLSGSTQMWRKLPAANFNCKQFSATFLFIKMTFGVPHAIAWWPKNKEVHDTKNTVLGPLIKPVPIICHTYQEKL